MNKRELIGRITDVLRDNDARKNVSAQKTVLHISDDQGNHSDFVVRKTERGLLYTNKDVTTIIETCIAVIEDAIKHGEEISCQGFGTLRVQKRAARRAKHPTTGEVVAVKERYIPKFNFGNSLRLAAKIYEASLSDNLPNPEDGEVEDS